MTQWHGDKTDGIEIRFNDDGSLDEVIVYVDGKCIVHLEQMSDVSWWVGLYAKGHTAHLDIGSKNYRSHVEVTPEAWDNTALKSITELNELFKPVSE